MKPKKATSILLFIITTTLLAFSCSNAQADSAGIIGSYNIIGTEDHDYNLSLEFVKRSQEFSLDDQKISFYMLGCDMVSESDDRVEFIIRNEKHGAKMVFIAPEAGRQSGEYSTADFYKHANSILRIQSTDKIIYEKIDSKWHITIGENDIEPVLYLEGKNSWNEKLKYTDSSNEPLRINLENYTLSREGGSFLMYHNFSPSSPLYDLGEKTLTFNSSEIMLRTFETRLKEASHMSYIEVVREPSRAIIGSIIRFTGDSDDGDNLATVTGIDKNGNYRDESDKKIYKIYISRYDSLSYNDHDAGTWLRCFADYGNGQVYDNEYPKVNLEPTTWSISVDVFNTLLTEHITPYDVTGLFDAIEIHTVDEDDFGYGLKNVTCSYDGLNFTGGLTGAFDIDMELEFFGQPLRVGPVHIDYATMANSIIDEILRINTYKREAFRFYFNPKIFESYCDWAGDLNYPEVFPLTFRIYFDKDFDLIGGNIRISIPGRGLPLPGGLAFVDNVGGGYTYPATFEVGAVFTDGFLHDLDFWDADVDAVLSLDRSYLTLDGRIWMWKKKIEIGDVSATIAWNYYKGKRFKGIEFSGETGIGAKKVNLVFDLTFKVKRYKSNGKTKSYIGGSGSGKIKAFGATFAGVGIKATSRKFSAYVNPPGPIGTKKVTVYYKNITNAVSSLSTNASGIYTTDPSNPILIQDNSTHSGVAILMDNDGRTIVLIPEAKRIDQSLTPFGYSILSSGSVNNTLNLPNDTKQAAITINYQGSIENIWVELPGGKPAEVVIADENTVEEPGKLYAMDYELDDTASQIYIEIDDAGAGDYTLSYSADTVTDTAIYEIVQVPAIENDEVSAVYNSGIVDLSWKLEQEISGDVKYHLTLQSLSDGEVIAEYSLYENMVVDNDGDEEDDGEETEIYVDDAALTVIGTNVSARIKLPDNLAAGTYAFVVEPVLNNIDEEDLEGEAVTSNTFEHTNPGIGAVVQTPTGVTVENTGNGITRIRWDYDPTVYSWDINIRDLAGNKVGTTSILSENLIPGRNLYVAPLSMTPYVYANIGIDSNVFATATVSEAQYDTDYKFDVSAVQRIPYVGGDYYNSLLGYIDMDNIEADVNENYLIYKAASEETTGRFIESEGLKFYLEIYDGKKESPVFSANLFEGDTGEIGYDYDFDSDLDIESLRQIDMGALVMRTNALDSLRLLPDKPVKKFGIVILSPSGRELLNIPALTLADLTQPNGWLNIAAELASNYPDLSTDAILQLQQIYQAGAISVEDPDDIHIDLSLLSSLNIVDEIESGRYTISLTTYNANNDKIYTDFEIYVRDIIPAVFIDTITRISGKKISQINDNSHRVVGFANGAATIAINGHQTDVIDGLFELVTDIDSEVIVYEVTDEFGDLYAATIEYSEYSEVQDNESNGSCFITSCFHD